MRKTRAHNTVRCQGCGLRRNRLSVYVTEIGKLCRWCINHNVNSTYTVITRWEGK